MNLQLYIITNTRTFRPNEIIILAIFKYTYTMNGNDENFSILQIFKAITFNNMTWKKQNSICHSLKLTKLFTVKILTT